MTIKSIAYAALIVVATGLSAVADERYRPVADPQVNEECGACHMAFQPEMLPARSWNKIMDDLADHFGEDASLRPEAIAHIRAYHVDNAADSGWLKGRFMRGLSDDQAPLRITETPHWLREHRPKEVPVRAWRDPRVKSKANCVACHRKAERGDYDDD